ncbi:TPA: hypothetical protein ACHGUG_001684 [Klebsiella pneumoniae]
MTKSTITRERLEKIKSWRETYGAGSNVMLPAEEAEELACIALAEMGSRPHTDDELSNLLWYSQEATCHSDPNYYCEFQRLATPGFIASIIRELQERRKADSEPVAWLLSGGGAKNVVCFDSGNAYADPLREVTPLYRHPQPAPVVQCPFPCGWDNLNKLAIQDAALVARGLVEGELTTEAHRQAAISNNDRLLKVISACRAAMLHAGNSPANQDCWCRTCRPVVLNDMRFVVCPDCGNKRCPRANDHRNACTRSNEPGQEGSAYPAAPQEVRGE